MTSSWLGRTQLDGEGNCCSPLAAGRGRPHRHGRRRRRDQLFVLGQTVLIPVALAVFLTFLLAPLVSFLQRRDLGRMPAVLLVVLLAALGLGGTVCLVTAEVTSLAGELPTYTENIKEKIRSLRRWARGTRTPGKDDAVTYREWNLQPTSAEAGKAKVRAVGARRRNRLRGHVQPESPAWLSRLPAVLSPVVELLGGLALALVLVVFMLLKREALRDRLIRLVGHGRLTVTTKAVEDAGQRISRFLLMQFIINAGFGLCSPSGFPSSRSRMRFVGLSGGPAALRSLPWKTADGGACWSR